MAAGLALCSRCLSEIWGRCGVWVILAEARARFGRVTGVSGVQSAVCALSVFPDFTPRAYPSPGGLFYLLDLTLLAAVRPESSENRCHLRAAVSP